MKLKIAFPFAPLPQNNIERTGYKTNVRYKTKEAKDYKAAIEVIVKSNLKTKEFKESFNEKVHGLSIAFMWYLNYKDLITQTGKVRRIKKNTIDCDGPIKFTQDCILKAIGIDDVFINDVKAIRVPTKERSSFYVIIQRHELLKDVIWREFLIP